jgi:hypothetical protein
MIGDVDLKIRQPLKKGGKGGNTRLWDRGRGEPMKTLSIFLIIFLFETSVM